MHWRKRKRARSLIFNPLSLDLQLSWNSYCRGISHFDIIIDWSATLTHDKYYGWGFNTTRTRPLLFSPHWEVMLALRHGQWLIVNGGGGGQTQFWLFLWFSHPWRWSRKSQTLKTKNIILWDAGCQLPLVGFICSLIWCFFSACPFICTMLWSIDKCKSCLHCSVIAHPMTSTQ